MSGNGSLLDAILGSASAASSEQASAPRRAVIWARVSTDMQEERGLSMPEQLRQLRDHAASHDIEVVEEYQEAASAFQREDKRVEFHRMVARAEQDASIDRILVHDMSRCSRDSGRAKVLLGELRRAGVEVVSLSDPVADPETVAGVYVEAITLAKNEAYSREIAFHTRKGCRANVQTRDAETGWCYKNGGQPPWGYRGERLVRGMDKKGRQILKAIWVPDDRVVAGRPVHEWAQHCLVELAAKGAALHEISDFCNNRGIPATRKPYWGASTWNALLQPNALLQYCGYGVWNVHRKNGSKRPPSEWLVVANAHPAILTDDEAARILEARRWAADRVKHFDTGYGRSRASRYLLSGGLFKCGRCGSNMTGFRTSSGSYYVCGSAPYRRGRGCGAGVYVPQAEIEAEVAEGLRGLVGFCSDPKGFTRVVNAELARQWHENTGTEGHGAERLQEIEAKVANIRRSIEDGLADVSWANERLSVLARQSTELRDALARTGKPPQVDASVAIEYRRRVEELLHPGNPSAGKQLLRELVQKVELAPEEREVEITYRLPEPVMNGVVAGAGFEPATYGL